MTQLVQADSCPVCGSTDAIARMAVLMPFVAHRVFGYTPTLIEGAWGLRDIKENNIMYMPCRTIGCKGCGSLYLDIRFTEQQCNNLYSGYRGEEYTRQRESFEPGYTLRNTSMQLGLDYVKSKESFISPFLVQNAPITLLDWGANNSKTTPFANNPNFKITAYDISGESDVDNIEDLMPIYDIVVCSHVLEHVPFPVRELKKIKSKLKKGALLYLELPHEKVMTTSYSLLKRIEAKKHWHEHINFFSLEGMKLMSLAAGFECLKISSSKKNAPGNFDSILQGVFRSM